MRAIKNKTYNNFMRVVRMIEKKGYDFDESVRVSHRIFDEYEQNPQGLSVLARVTMIVDAR